MGRHSNRKHNHNHNRKRDLGSFSLADTLHSVKRRRLSQDGSDNGPPQRSRSNFANGSNETDGWQTVPARSSKHRNRPSTSSKQQRSSFPSLSFNSKVTRPLMIEQLRDLALYVLADGLGPTWVAVSNSRAISKVVVIMVPGMDNIALKRTRQLMREMKARSQDNQIETRDQTTDANNDTEMRGNESTINDVPSGTSEEIGNSNAEATAIATGTDDPAYPSGHCGWLLDDTIPVKAPGDAKYSKVHSPLQAMLVTPISDPADKASSRQAAEKQFRSIPTPITHFIHTSDELREAEYPIHPATFTSAADAALEFSRRESTGQSASAGWVDSNVMESSPLITASSFAHPCDQLSQGLDIYAIDCEMVLTSDEKLSLARLSVVSWPDGKMIIDKYIKPDLPIENYFTQFSGITPKILDNVTTRLSDVQQELLNILTPSTVLLGHSLESDLNALKMTHPFIIDTSMIFPHPRGLPLRSSLKFLANKYLKREIQLGGAKGHDSIEDAQAVLDLVKLKCEKGPKFGSLEANGETIFKRLSKNGRKGAPLTSAIVEYGSSPERGLGKDATYAIGCQNDDEITTGLIRAIKGDEDAKEISAGGADFVWGRLRAVEFARGWVTSSNIGANHSTTPKTTEDEAPEVHSDAGNADISQEELDKVISSTLQNICTVRNALPPTTLLMIYSGTSDVRPVLRLQALQAQYRKEFKVKKWDELSVKWTDVEEQALRNAAENARQGWGWIGVV